MSRGTSTAALALVLVALGAYIWFVERKREPADPDAKAKVFAALQADQIEELTIKGSTGDTTTRKRDTATWRLPPPGGATAERVESGAWPSGPPARLRGGRGPRPGWRAFRPFRRKTRLSPLVCW